MSKQFICTLAGSLMILFVAPYPVHAQASDPESSRIAELQAKLDKLEARVALLEKKVADDSPTTQAIPATQPGAQSADGRAPEAQRQALQAQARARMRKDREKYTQAQIAEAEQLYQVANKNWRSPEAKQSLEQLV